MTSNRIPEWAILALEDYVNNGHYLGGFLRAVVSNNLINAFSLADDENGFIMKDYAKYVYNEMPMTSWGSEAIYEEWRKLGGLNGEDQFFTLFT